MATNSADFYRLRLSQTQIPAIITDIRQRVEKVDMTASPDTLFPTTKDRIRKVVDRFELALKWPIR